MRQKIQGIKDENEKQFVKIVSDYFIKADAQYRPFLTDFYNIDWMQSMMKRYFHEYSPDLYTFYGGYEGAERQVMCVCPFALPKEAYEISVLQLKVKTGIGKPLTHRDYLGAVLGLGIDRKLVGDIVLNPEGAYIIVNSGMTAYIRSQLLSIGRYQKLEIEEIPLGHLQVEKPKTKEIRSTVSSLRADAVAAVCFGISRSECAKLIQGEKVKRNGVAASLSESVSVGDVFSVRGYGKAKLVAVNGQTKKERLHITIEKYI